VSAPLKDRVVIVTGGGRGLGRAHALELGVHGATVIVNDLPSGDTDPAGDVAAEIVAAGGSAVAVRYDVTSETAVAELFQQVRTDAGAVHAVVNNAGILRDRMLVNMSVDEWDAVVAVHMRGTFLMTREAARYWREMTKAGHTLNGRIVNTTSAAGLYGNIGQANYGAAKAGIAAFTLIAAEELGRYGVCANTLVPNARTRMTEALFAETMATPGAGEFDRMDPGNASPLVAWLCSEEARVSGQTFTVLGGDISVNEGWHEGPREDLGRRWTIDEVAQRIPALVENARPAMPVLGTEESGIVPSSR
jgi:NAD(P)-dependent dehydrogenase (short-subunit alcohol dehydrogenase family)